MEANNIPQGYKVSAVGVIPSDWEVKRLEEIVDPKRKISYGIVQTGETVKDGIMCIRVIDLVDGQIDRSKLITTSKEISESYKRTILVEGDIILALRGKVGESVYIDHSLKGCNLTRGLALISRSECVFGKYIAQALNAPMMKTEFAKKASGSALQEISISALRGVEILLPPIAEQERIAEVLGCWDVAIEKQGALVEKLTERKRALMQQLLTAKKRLPNFSAPWQKFRYSDILKETKRKLVWDDSELYRLISVKRRSGGLFERESLYGHQIKTKNLRPALAGDFLISKMQIVHGASGLTTVKFDNMKISGSYIALVAKDPQALSMEFLDWWSKMPYFYHQTYISSYGVHIEKMTFDLESFMVLDMLLPSLEEQTAIAQILNTANQEIEQANATLEALRLQKRGLMQQLLTGKKRLKL